MIDNVPVASNPVTSESGSALQRTAPSYFVAMILQPDSSCYGIISPGSNSPNFEENCDVATTLISGRKARVSSR